MKRSLLLGVLFAVTACLPAFAQQQDATGLPTDTTRLSGKAAQLPAISISRVPSASELMERIDAVPGLADEIRAALKDNPLLGEKLRSLGNWENLPLSEVLQASAEARQFVARELVRRGYASPDDFQLDFGDRSPDSDLKQGQRQPTATTGEEDTGAEETGLQDNDYSQNQEARLRTEKGTVPAKEGSTNPRKEPDADKTRAVPTPYRQVPSLRDLYAQFPDRRTASLKRFGQDLFTKNQRYKQDLLPDMPASRDYALNVGDEVILEIWGTLNQRFRRTIDSDGQIALPEVGTVMVAGRKIDEAEAVIEHSLRQNLKEVRVNLSLAKIHTIRVYVVGDVESPGAYDVSSLSTPLNVLIAAGGPTRYGSYRVVRQFRSERLVSDIDLYSLMLNGMNASPQYLQSGDTLLVPPAGPQVEVTGMVRRPAIYELHGEKNVSELLKLAGGVLVTGSLKRLKLERVEAHQQRTMLEISIPNDASDDQLRTAFEKEGVQDGDRLTISPILPYNRKVVYLEGHVYFPGKYPYFEGMALTDLVRSYRDLLPEPADRAEIVRLVPPDLRPVTIPVALADTLDKKQDPVLLQPFDTVRVLGRYEVDPPTVSIFGPVAHPGEYPLGRHLSVAELINAAGGLLRSASTEEAELASYAVQDGKRVQTKFRTVDLKQALEGTFGTELQLQPGDVLTVRQVTGWEDIGAAAEIKGEVTHPGKYGIEEGEHLSSVLLRAGGFRESAYPAGAVLERVQVREIAAKQKQELIDRIKMEAASTRFDARVSGQEQLALSQAFAQQQQQVLNMLENQEPSGRLVIRISSDIAKWRGTAADIELRKGDVVTIPKRPGFVLVSGQVYNNGALTYVPGKSAKWYLRQAGGSNSLGDSKEIIVIRANGSVIGRKSKESGLWGGGVLSSVLQPGDSIFVPAKPVSTSSAWKELIQTAQFVSSLAIAAKIAVSF